MQAIQSRIRQEMAGNLETGIKTGKKSAKRRQKQYDDYFNQTQEGETCPTGNQVFE